MKIKLSPSVNATLNHMTLKAIVISGQMLTIPLFLRNYQQDQYILWIMLNALATFMLFADSGIIQTYSIPLTREFSDSGFVNKILVRQLIIKLVLSQLVLFICVILIFHFFKIGAEQDEDSERIALFLLLVAANVLTVIQHFYLVYFQIRRRYSFGIGQITGAKFVEIILQIFIVLCGFKLVILVLTMLLVRVISVFCLALEARSVSYSSESPLSGELQTLSSILGTTAVTSTVILSSQGVLIVVGQWSTTTGVLLFSITRMLCSPIRLIGDSISLGIFPSLIEPIEKNVNRLKLLHIREYFLISFVFVIMLIFLGDYTSSFLSHNLLKFDLSFVLLVAASTFLDGFLMIILQQIIAVGKIFRIGIGYLAITLLELMILATIPVSQSLSIAVSLNMAGDLLILFWVLRVMSAQKS